MPSKVFISYRRDDSAGHAGRVHDRLAREFGGDLLFMDVDGIPLGVDFVEVIGAEVAKCDVLLAIIGPTWLDSRSEEGERRLDSEDDFVRIEIGTALKRNIPVIPILLEGTRVPKPEQLPDDLKGLARRNGLSVRHASFHNDIDKLVASLRGPGAAPAAHAAQEPPGAHGRVKPDAAIAHGVSDGWFKPGAGRSEWFKDFDIGPEMVVVPAGSFTMGSPHLEAGRADNEGPQHKVTFAKPFAVGRLAVTFDEWDACVAAGGCGGYRPDHQGWGCGRRPVINVSWHDAGNYIAWLSQKTGKRYRLLSEAEWEYVARAGTTTPFWWGNTIAASQANYDGDGIYAQGTTGENRKRTLPADLFEANPWGLFQVHGNVWEWVEDFYHDSYQGAPVDGSAWTDRGDRRMLRGGSWFSAPALLRSALRGKFQPDIRDLSIGLRVAQSL